MLEETLSFHPEDGTFSFGLVDQPSTGAFRIRLGSPGTIAINAGSEIEFVPLTPDSAPVEALSLNNSGAFEVLSLSATQITLNVTTLPSTGGVLGFMLFVQRTTGSLTVQGIETPAFFITQDEPFTAPHLVLHYVRATGDFHFGEGNSDLDFQLLLPVEKGVVVLRLSEGGSNDSGVQTIPVTLHDSTATAGVKFAAPAAVSTLPPGSLEPVIDRLSDTLLTVTRPFTPGTGFGVSFAIKVPLEGSGTCTVFSPDPVIIDKQIGGTG